MFKDTPKTSLIEAIARGFAAGITGNDPNSSSSIEPLVGADVPWYEWVPRYYLKNDCAPFAPYHKLLWEWFDGLSLGSKSPSVLAPWSRGLGKSSTLEGGIVRTCVKASRKFWVYVSRTLEDANNHVMSIARVLERMGVERSVNKYGLAQGWNAQRLRTSSGFNVMSFGLDAGARGIKLDDLRPDGIALDDIDHLGDTQDMVLKKIKIISSTILQAGSPDFAAIFVQNEIGPNTVMAHVLDGRAGIFLDRDIELAVRVPAIYDIKYEPYLNDQGLRCARITGGTSSWLGKTIEDWQYQIDKGGIDAFMIECQHDIRRDGTFFTNYDPAKHLRRPNATEGPCKLCKGHSAHVGSCIVCAGSGLFRAAPLPCPEYWKFFGGLDYGRSRRNPFAFVFHAFDHEGNLKIIDEIQESVLSPEQQGERMIQMIEAHGVKVGDVTIHCGPEIFAKEQPHARAFGARPAGNVIQPGWSMFASSGRHIADIYRGMGLNVVPAVSANTHDERINGWAAINRYLDKPGGLTIYEGRCPNLARTLASVPPSKSDSRDLDSNSDDHLCDALRFSVRQPVVAPELPEAAKYAWAGSQSWMMRELDKRRKHAQKKAKARTR